jgi:hypothetical protein
VAIINGHLSQQPFREGLAPPLAPKQQLPRDSDLTKELTMQAQTSWIIIFALALEGLGLENVTQSIDRQPEILFYFPPPRYHFQPGKENLTFRFAFQLPKKILSRRRNPIIFPCHKQPQSADFMAVTASCMAFLAGKPPIIYSPRQRS